MKIFVVYDVRNGGPPKPVAAVLSPFGTVAPEAGHKYAVEEFDLLGGRELGPAFEQAAAAEGAKGATVAAGQSVYAEFSVKKPEGYVLNVFGQKTPGMHALEVFPDLGAYAESVSKQTETRKPPGARTQCVIFPEGRIAK